MKFHLETNFQRDDRGALTHFMLVLFTGILLSTGVALDLIRQDSERTDLQDALDRGVIAAASLTQALDPETTLREYLKNRAFSSDALRVSVDVVESTNYRSVTASAEYDMPTIFLGMVGLSTLTVPANASARQSDPDIEISLVLDISGSMAREVATGTSVSRLEVLRWAASGFVDTILTDAAQEKTSVTLVPFAGQVNAGPLFDVLSQDDHYPTEHCVEFDDTDFSRADFPTSKSRSQAPQFQWFRFEGDYGHEAKWGWCPTDDQAVRPFSNDPDALKTQIKNLAAHDGNGTQIGLKYGLGLLDPSSQPLTEALVATGAVDVAFRDRPAAFNDPGALKVIVIMTDGDISYQQRPKKEFADTTDKRDELKKLKLSNGKSSLENSNQQDKDEADRIKQFAGLCDVAKQNGVIVFTIGFDISAASPGYNQMRNCASSVGHFYHVQGLELDVAFKQIANTITKLKLVE